MSHEHESFGLHLGFKIARMALHAATVAAAFLTVKELHKVHKAIERKK